MSRSTTSITFIGNSNFLLLNEGYLRPFIHQNAEQPSTSTFRIRLCNDIWRYIFQFIDNSNPRFVWEYKLTTNIYFTFKNNLAISKTTFYIDNQHTLNECVSYYNKKYKRPCRDLNIRYGSNNSYSNYRFNHKHGIKYYKGYDKKITLFLGPGVFTIPPLEHHFDIYGCYSNRTTINQIISVLNSECSLHHLVLVNQEKALHAKDSNLLVEDCLFYNCMVGIVLIDSNTILRSSSVCSNDIPVILMHSDLTLENCEYRFNRNNVEVNKKCRSSNLIFDKNCSVIQEGSLLTSLKHERSKVTYYRGCYREYESERWTERILSARYNNTNKIYIFFTYISSHVCDPNNFYFGAETAYISELQPDYFDDFFECDYNKSDIIDFENCNYITFTENTMSTDIFRNIVLKIFSNSRVESINISQMDIKWLTFLKVYYSYLGWKELKWMYIQTYYGGRTSHLNLWEKFNNYIDEVKPFWEVFKIKYVDKLFKQAGFFVDNGEIFIKSTKTNNIAVPNCYDTKSKGADRRNRLLKDKKNMKRKLFRKEIEKIKLLKHMKKKKKKRKN